MNKEKDFEEVQWLKDKLDKNEVISMRDFAITFEYLCEDDADTAFKALMSKSFVTRPTRTALQNNYEIWKRNNGPAFWASQTATLSLTQTASELVAEGAHVAKDLKRARYCTEEPWHSLMISLIKIVNGQSNVSFPEAPTDMKYIHGQLFRHAVSLLEEYQAQCSADKDTTLIKDAQCDFIENPPFGSAAPSENDCLQLWSYVFGTIVDKVTIHSGEKILDASKVLRQQQASEYGDVSDTGRKVDLIFMYKDIELSNLEFKRTDISSRNIALQCRKNVRLGRCLQEAHATYGFKDASVIMGDVAGFVGLFYQVKPMREVSIAGKTSASMVYLPTTSGALEAFLEGTSLAMIWKFVEFLEDQGPKIARAKERHQIDLETMKFSQAIGSSKSLTPPPAVKKYDNNVTFSPTKKRLYSMYSATVD
ncbi:hypothetical protein BGW39_002097 [Mortierella sp. 14UC]|nr:hypothetical protein BGW39_002097 [Mortierella sp. 14UC]